MHPNGAPIFDGSHPAAGRPSVLPHLRSLPFLPNGTSALSPRQFVGCDEAAEAPATARLVRVCTVPAGSHHAHACWGSGASEEPFLFLSHRHPNSGIRPGPARAATLARGAHCHSTDPDRHRHAGDTQESALTEARVWPLAVPGNTPRATGDAWEIHGRFMDVAAWWDWERSFKIPESAECCLIRCPFLPPSRLAMAGRRFGVFRPASSDNVSQ